MRQEASCKIYFPFEGWKVSTRVSAATFESLASELPEFTKGSAANQNTRLEIGYTCGSEGEIRILKSLSKHGLKPRWNRYPSLSRMPDRDPMIVQMEGKRTFEYKDLEAAEFYVFAPQKKIAEAEPPQGVRLGIKPGSISSTEIGWISAAATNGCSEAFRRRLIATGFTAPHFRSLANGETGQGLTNIFELRSNLTLPPMAEPPIYSTGEPWRGERDAHLLFDDVFHPPIIKYRRDHMKHQLFDVAESLEHSVLWVGRPGWWASYLVVSRRFRQWCISQKIKADWWPVQLVD
jgi:hypothetical protein